MGNEAWGWAEYMAGRPEVCAVAIWQLRENGGFCTNCSEFRHKVALDQGHSLSPKREDRSQGWPKTLGGKKMQAWVRGTSCAGEDGVCNPGIGLGRPG